MSTDLPVAPPVRLRHRIGDWLRRIVRASAPSRAAWRGASLAVALVALVLWVSAMIDVMTADSVAGPLVVGGGFVLVAVLGTGLCILLAAVLRHTPLVFRWTSLASIVLLAVSFSFVPLGTAAYFGITAFTALSAITAGAATGALASGSWHQSGIIVRMLTLLFGVAGVGSLITAGVWLAGAGSPRQEIPLPATRADGRTAPSTLDDPAAKGSHAVKTTTYGSGTDRYRPEFGEDVALRTMPVDGSNVLKGWSGMTGWARTRFWGFDAKALPLNGRVWYPDGDGPFPLVLIAHGNHLAADFSDPGYEYLGQLLASRGYIFVSVDENFLNSMESDLHGGLDHENNARGWLLLEHLRVWHAWNAEKGPFFQKVDTDRIALVGHSRGGEAVAHAAAFNRLPFNPDNALARFDYGYHIRSLVAIAPADRQFRPAGASTRLADVNYFTIQGSHDSDVSSFYGLHQFDRVKFSDGADIFKSAVYVYGANHGQFNTSWGQFDVGAGLAKRMASTAALLNADEQRRVAEVYISAFLDCTLRGVSGYRALFQDSGYGAKWLPNTIYLTQYADGHMKPLCTFDEDIDLSTAGVEGSKIAASNLTLWREARMPLRAEANEDRAVILGWDRDHHAGQPSYEVTWSAEAFPLDEESVLSFAMADGNENPTPDDETATSERNKSQGDGPREPIDLTIELADAAGHAARLPLGHFALVQPQMETVYLKSKLLQRGALSEPILKTFFFPLADFRDVSAELDLSSIVKLRLIFDRTAAGVVIFDKAAFGTK